MPDCAQTATSHSRTAEFSLSSFDTLTGPADIPEVRFSPQPYAASANRDCSGYLARIGVPEQHRGDLLPLLDKMSKAELFFGVAMMRSQGCSWEDLALCLSRFYNPDNLALTGSLKSYNESYDTPELRYQSRFRFRIADTELRQFPFEVDFLDYNPRELPEGGYFPGEYRAFGMYLAPSERRSLPNTHLLFSSQEGFPSCFAHLRYCYFEYSNTYMVTDIQSELSEWFMFIQDYDYPEELVVRALSTGFEDFILRTHQGPSEPKLFIADLPELLNKTDRKILVTDTGDSDLCKKQEEIHRVFCVSGIRCLKHKGYIPVVNPDEVIGFDDSYSPVPIRSGYMKTINRETVSPLADSLEHIDRNRFSPWFKIGMALKDELLQDHENCLEQRYARTEQKQIEFKKKIADALKKLFFLEEGMPSGVEIIETVPTALASILERHPFSDRYIYTGLAINTQFLNFPFRKLNAVVSCVSRGGQYAEDDWGNIGIRRKPGWHVILLHLREMNRHPHLVFIHHGEDGYPTECYCSGIKAGGLKDKDPSKIILPDDGAELPIYPQRDEEKVSASMLQPWGGGHLQTVYEEFMILYSLHWGLLATCKKLAAAPLPQDIRYPRRLPVWKEGKVHWMNEIDYRKVYLRSKDSRDALGLLHSDPESPFRVNGLFDGIFCLPDEVYHSAELLKQQIDCRMRTVYLFNKERFVTPEAAQSFEKSDLNWLDVVGYLHEIFLSNKKTAEKIMRTIETRTLRTIAVVHGAGGFLGGDPTKKFGIQSGSEGGGPCEKRNFGITGVLNDLEGGVFLPWNIPGFCFDLISESEKNEIQHHQQADLLDWQVSIYILRNILFGRSFPQDEYTRRFPFGKPGEFFFGKPAELPEESTVIERLLYPGWVLPSFYAKREINETYSPKRLLNMCLQPVRFSEQRHSRIYFAAAARGQGLMETLRFNPDYKIGMRDTHRLLETAFDIADTSISFKDLIGRFTNGATIEF